MENHKSHCNYSVFQAAAESRTEGSAAGIRCVKENEILVFDKTELLGTLSSHVVPICLQVWSSVKLLNTARGIQMFGEINWWKHPRKRWETPVMRSIWVCSSTSRIRSGGLQTAHTSMAWQDRSDSGMEGRVRILFCLITEGHYCLASRTNQISACQVAFT